MTNPKKTGNKPLTLAELRNAWNRDADPANNWDALDIDEMVLWAQQQVMARFEVAHPADGEVDLDPDVDHILRLAEIIRKVDGNNSLGAAALAEAILSHPGARWGPAAPQPPADGEVAELVAQLRSRHFGPGALDLAADLLEHLAPLKPIPVAKRLPEARDCAPWDDCEDLDPWCWVGLDGDGGWEWEQRSAAWLQALPAATHWLPAHALPLPSREVEA